ncbi:transmembrane protein, putative [Eimeria acervulina]|uniref:GDT1 family protein n=1 Tax=Eimeria acervulina TaxID=5801 RepID=U6GTM9_EIMAC|nr:transmembrane protein, putative [Eimeria acervulina]CDI83596.1 transmembrane protein, putative [Eimeria acervulina]
MWARLALLCSGSCLGIAQAAEGQFQVASEANSSWSSALVGTLFMIICSELGDKTFLITAILSMRCAKSSNSTKAQAGQKKLGSRWHVFAGGFLALALMTVMAAAGGQLLPLLLRQELRTIFMICLLVIFGAKMLHEAAVYNETAEEAEELKDLCESEESVNGSKLLRLARTFFSPVFLQTLFLHKQEATETVVPREWYAACECPAGAILGHGLCTALAVVGGNVLAKRISERVVLVLGGICFLSFAAFTAVGEFYGL